MFLLSAVQDAVDQPIPTYVFHASAFGIAYYVAICNALPGQVISNSYESQTYAHFGK